MASKKQNTKRTSRGNVTAYARKKHGMRTKGSKKGSFPIFDRESARSALRLRGHAKNKKARRNIISRAHKYLPGAAKKARVADKRKKLI